MCEKTLKITVFDLRTSLSAAAVARVSPAVEGPVAVATGTVVAAPRPSRLANFRNESKPARMRDNVKEPVKTLRRSAKPSNL
jgi:hypothetical protein